MTKRSLYWAGVILTFLYILIGSAQSVVLNIWLHGENIYFVVGSCFLIVTIVFGVAGVFKQAKIYKIIAKKWRSVVFLNLFSVSNWLLYFFSVKYLEPSVAITLIQGIGPVSMSAYTLLRGGHISRATKICHIGIFFMVIVMCVYVIIFRRDYNSQDIESVLLGVFMSIICGISITATILLSKKFASDGVPPSILLSVRFPVLILICSVIAPLQGELVITKEIVVNIVIISLFGVCGSTWCLQKGIELAPSLAVSTVLALSPLTVVALQVFNKNIPVSFIIMGIIFSITVFSVFSIFYEDSLLKKEKLSAASS